MSLLTKSKQFFLDSTIKKELRSRTRKVKISNLALAKSIGVVYDASTENDYNRAAGLIRHLQAQGKMVKSIGFVKYKDLPHYLPAKLNFDYITLKDVNWYGKPDNKFVTDFKNYDYDILIDLNLGGNQSLKYVVALSQAKFKIGLFNEQEKDIYDFMLEGIPSGKISLYIKELLHYLEIFNTK